MPLLTNSPKEFYKDKPEDATVFQVLDFDEVNTITNAIDLQSDKIEGLEGINRTFTEALVFDIANSYNDDYTQTGVLNFTLADVSFGYGSVYFVSVNTNGSAINFTDDFSIIRNDYLNLDSAKYDLIMYLAPDGKVRVSISHVGSFSLPYEYLLSSLLNGIQYNGNGDYESTLGGAQAIGLMNKSLASSTDGSIRIDIIDEATNQILVGFNSSNLNQPFADYEYGFFTDTSTQDIKAVLNGGVIVLDTPTTYVDGDVIELSRDSGILLIKHSTDGVNFTTVHSFGSDSVALYVNIQMLDTAMTVKGLRQSGLV